MGRDNHPRERQAQQLERKLNRKASYDRLLIVCEGSKTEPNYLNEIRIKHRLQTANVEITHSELGTEPIQIVDYAEQLFLHGDATKNIKPKAFEKVFAVFDRDDHRTYFDALGKITSLENRYKNDIRQIVTFESIVSIPSFELWLLLHFEDIQAIMHRDEVLHRVKKHIPGYEKGNSGIYSLLESRFDTATKRSIKLVDSNDPHDDTQPYTKIHELAELLKKLKEG
jgi:hypothetical protein